MKKVLINYQYLTQYRIRKLIIIKVIKVDSEVSLLPVGKLQSKRNGSITPQLEVADLRVATRCAVRNPSRVIHQRSRDANNLSQFIGDAAPDIENILELADDIAQVILLDYI